MKMANINAGCLWLATEQEEEGAASGEVGLLARGLPLRPSRSKLASRSSRAARKAPSLSFSWGLGRVFFVEPREV